MDDSTYNRFVRKVFTRYNVDNKDVNEILQLITQSPTNENLPSVISHCGPCDTLYEFRCLLLDLIYMLYLLITSWFE